MTSSVCLAPGLVLGAAGPAPANSRAETGGPAHALQVSAPRGGRDHPAYALQAASVLQVHALQAASVLPAYALQAGSVLPGHALQAGSVLPAYALQAAGRRATDRQATGLARRTAITLRGRHGHRVIITGTTTVRIGPTTGGGGRRPS